MTFSVDTNFFLQCRDPKDLPWREVTVEDELTVIVTRAVQQEIDRLKQDGKGRRSTRARKASSLLRQIVQSEDLQFVARERNPRVVLTLPPPLDPARTKPPTLDLSITDDRIIEETLAYAAAHPGESVALLTHDTNPLLTARQHQLRAVAIPDSWLLAPEPDEKDKAFQQLQRRVEALETSHPQVSLTIFDTSGEQPRSVELEIVRYAPLSRATISRLMDEVRSLHPIVTDFKTERHPPRSTVGISSTLEYPTEKEIREYQGKAYPSWLKSVEAFFTELAKYLEHQQKSIDLTVALINGGTKPAENVLIEFEVRGGLMLKPPQNDSDHDDEADQALRFPEPPIAPRPKRVSIFDQMGAMSRFHDPFGLREHPTITPIIRNDFIHAAIPDRRDRHGFYWKPRRPMIPERHWALECEEFRHQLDPEIFSVSLTNELAPPNEGKAFLGCRVSAQNLAEPVRIGLPISITYKDGDTEAEARRFMKSISYPPKSG